MTRRKVICDILNNLGIRAEQDISNLLYMVHDNEELRKNWYRGHPSLFPKQKKGRIPADYLSDKLDEMLVDLEK